MKNLQKLPALILILLILISFGAIMTNHVYSSARAVIVSPRLGASIRGPTSYGGSGNSTDFLSETITVWVSPDPCEAPIPKDWKEKTNWNVALLPSVMKTANCTPLKIVDVFTGPNEFVLFGGGMDVNSLYSNALGIICKIPANIAPIQYDLIIGFKESINPSRQANNEIDIIPKIGSWQGKIGSAYSSLFTPSKSFILSEPSVISIPWIYDAKSSDSANLTDKNGIKHNPFTVLHLTDTHYNSISQSITKQNYLWQNDSLVLSPDLIILSGDVIDDPNQRIQDYELAYNNLVNLNLPLIMGSGNHDNYDVSPWRHYFGPLFSRSQFDDLSIISFDTSLPLGTGVLNWIENNAVNARQTGPVFLTCHYPLVGSYLSSGWPAIANMMVKNNITAILTGHTHEDLIAEISKLKDNYELAEITKTELNIDIKYSDLMLGKQTTITNPTTIITRAAGKGGKIPFKAEFPNVTSGYSGYRKINIINNNVINFTYDYNGDGIRDQIMSTPNGRFQTKIEMDANAGITTAAGAIWSINSSYNEEIPAARALFLIPNAPTNMYWDLNNLNKTAGAYIRCQINNGTHTWIDARVPLPQNSFISLEILPRAEV
jgi:predicted phosphodiesterase